MKKLLSITTVLVFAFSIALFGADMEKKQTICPVKGKKVKASSKYVEAEGFKIYVCCGGCVKTVKKNPKKYIAKLQKEGIKLEKAK